MPPQPAPTNTSQSDSNPPKKLAFIPKLQGAILIACACAAVLRLTARDRWRGLDAAYYATPWPVLAVIAAAIAWRALRRRRRIMALSGFVGALGAGAIHLSLSHFAGAPARSAAEEPAGGPAANLRIACWNVGRGTFGWGSLPRTLATFDADILCLVESKGLDTHLAALQLALPGHTLHFLSSGFSVFCRDTVANFAIEAKPLRLPRGVATHVTLELGLPPHAASGRLSLILADIPSNPFGERGPTIATLTEHALAGPHPTILLGDFNTPRNSVHFDPLRERFAHSFEAVGTGWVETWPSPLPVLDLDHVWCGPRVRPLRCETRGGWGSDHRAVLLDVALSPH